MKGGKHHLSISAIFVGQVYFFLSRRPALKFKLKVYFGVNSYAMGFFYWSNVLFPLKRTTTPTKMQFG